MAGIKHGDNDANQQGKCLAVSAAAKEILQIVLSQSSKTGIHVSIKSTKTLHNSPSESWFYIKVTSKARIDRIHLEGKHNNPALYTVLEYMQPLENESHLCIQNPCDIKNESQSSYQQNLYLEGERLNVLNEVRRSKKIEESIIHLRVHDSKYHMMEECAHVYSYMSQVRVFRPKADMSFTMKIGEAVSHTDYRVESRRKLSTYLPSVVTDAGFYLQDSDVIAVSDTVVPCTVDPVLTSVQVLTAHNEYSNRSLQISSVGIYVPVDQTVATSFCTLTFYGPGYLPLDVTVPCNLLADVDWSRYRLNVDNGPTSRIYKGLLPHHSSLILNQSGRGCEIGCFIIQVFILLQFNNTHRTIVDGEEISQNLELLCRKCGSTMIGVIQEIIDKLLQPVLNHAKNRDVVMRSISGICKAVTDIVSMSSNEQFRIASLQSMKVKDTVELGVELNHKLTDISQRKHARVWAHCQRKYSSSFKNGQEVTGCGSRGEGQEVIGCGSRGEGQEVTGCGSRGEGQEVTGCGSRGEGQEVTGCGSRGEGQEVTGCGSRGDQGFIDGGTSNWAFVITAKEDNVVQYDRTVEKPHGSDCSNRNNDANKDSNVVTNCASLIPYIVNLNKTQGDLNIASYKEIDGDFIRRTERKSFDPEKTPEEQKITEDMEKVSPFQQLINVRQSVDMDITPDLLKITQGMKDVSPFQQLTEANGEYTVDAEVGIEDPFPPDPQTVTERQSTALSMTPDLEQVTQGMKDVSPFQQLACDDQIVPASPNINIEDPCLPQQGQITECLVNSQDKQSICLNKGANSVNKFNLKQESINYSLNREKLASASSQRTCFTVKDKSAPNLLKAHVPLYESDFELLNSEEFGPTLETVSEFMDDMNCVDKFQMITGKSEDSKYDMMVNDNQSLNLAGKLSQHSKILPHGNNNDHSENKGESKDNDVMTKSLGLSEKPGRDAQNIDDWFNDVLLEVGEWFD